MLRLPCGARDQTHSSCMQRLCSSPSTIFLAVSLINVSTGVPLCNFLQELLNPEGSVSVQSVSAFDMLYSHRWIISSFCLKVRHVTDYPTPLPFHLPSSSQQCMELERIMQCWGLNLVPLYAKNAFQAFEPVTLHFTWTLRGPCKVIDWLITTLLCLSIGRPGKSGDG